jgi:hypothetical protein
LKLFQSGAWDAAYAEFSAADSLSHSPVFILYMARSRTHAGQWVLARALYERLLCEELSADTPPQWQAAVEDARTELRALAPRIPRIRVLVRPSLPASAVVLLDGSVLQFSESDPVVEVDPGRHVVVVRPTQGTPTTKVFSATEADQGTALEVPLPERQSPATAAPEPARAAAPEPRRASGEATWQKTVGYATLGLGVLGLGIGAVTGWYALQQANQVKRGCIEVHCLRSDADRAAAAEQLGRGATAEMIAGGIALGVGVTLLTVAPFSRPASPTGSSVNGVLCTGRF